MRRFRFRLERFLELRRYYEREHELKLAKVTGACLMIQRNILNRQSNIARTILERPQTSGPVDLEAFHAGEMYMERLDREIHSLEEELTVKEEERTEAQKEYIEASRRRKVLEKLKEKKEEEHVKDQKREEFEILNDINTGSSSRRRITG